MLELQASSLAEVLQAVKEIRSKWGTDLAQAEEIWFRGNSARAYPLLPGLYRDSTEKYQFDEMTLFERFKALAAPLVTVRPDSDWEWYFVAQHYGLPTRLLDWTENLFCALYFAIEPHVREWDRPTFENRRRNAEREHKFGFESPTVWVLEVGTLNAHSLDDDCVAVPGGPTLESYLPSQLTINSSVNKLPVGLFPARSSGRIVAQQGVFTIHGQLKIAIDKLSDESSDKVLVAAINIDQNHVAEIWGELQLTGINRLSLFPDLSSVAPHLCWLYQSG